MTRFSSPLLNAVSAALKPLRTQTADHTPPTLFENLEERRLLSVSISGNELRIDLNNNNDYVWLNQNGSNFQIKVNSTWYNDWDTGDFSQVRVITRGGDDQLDVSTDFTRKIIAFGGDGNDTLEGSTSGDSIQGGNGQDKIYGRGGNDTIFGEGGNDTIDGDGGNDNLNGGSGNDRFYGDGGNDSIYGNSGHDKVNGGSGNDYISMSDGNDTVWGDSGNDTIYGGNNNDELIGGSNNDNIYGDSGSDKLWGSDGTDGLFGGDGSDTIQGDGGSDRYLDYHNGSFQDQHNGFSSGNDTRMRFKNGSTYTASFFGISQTYSGAAWAEWEIERLDKAFAVLHQETNNDNLLEKYNGGEITFTRQGNKTSGGGSTAAGWNNSGDIWTANGAFNHGENFSKRHIVHEIGHNFDTEYDASGWQALSGWSTSGGSGKTAATGGWYYNNSANFVSEYARTNPNEDFATSFSAYFAAEEGWGTADDAETSITHGSMSGKHDFIEDMIDYL
ncbi:MAG: hypothetical protein AAF743_00830 [Planctomycetota bacterium]